MRVPNTDTQLYVQIVFAVKGRKNLIDESWEAELHKYITAIVQNKGQELMAINGMPDHIHIFVSLNGSGNISDIVREIKKSSHTFINENKFCPQKFQWQSGYGAFSYSQSAVPNVVRYILNQKEHHKKKTFKKEYIEFLEAFEIEYKDEYLFEWYDNKVSMTSDVAKEAVIEE